VSAALIRRSVLRAGGLSEYQDEELSAANIEIGSRADSTLQLADPRVAAHHADISFSGTVARLRAVDAAVVVNGVSVKSTRLAIGDTIDFGSYRLQVFEPPTGFVFALLVEQTGKVSEQTWDQRFVTTLRGAGLNKRMASWVLGVLLMLAFLVLPLGSSLLRKGGLLGTEAPITESAWISGALSGAHQFVTKGDCLACHEKPFRQARDSACVACHDSVENHAREEVSEGVKCDAGSASGACAVKGWLATHELTTERCGACHREHNEPSTLVQLASRDCTACHGVADPVPRPDDPLQAVTGFGPGSHPEFEVTLTKAIADSRDEEFQVVTSALATAKEESNLNFSHAQHLDAERVRPLDGTPALTCSGCHQADDAGEHFKPISMRESCEGCHELTFDADDPDRTLPHGDAPEAVRVMREHFLRKYVMPKPKGGQEFSRRRLPEEAGRKSIACTGSPLECATSGFKQVYREQFQQKDEGCAKCHAITDRPASDEEQRFAVRTIHLPRDFIPAARFPHDQHRILAALAGGREVTGDSACLACHAASKSDNSRDVLLPAREVCFDCHRDESTRSPVALFCTDCHGYHPQKRPNWPQDIPGSEIT